MKILQINASYKPAYTYGGPTMSVSQLTEHLQQAGCYTEVFTTTANGKTELPVVANAHTIVSGVPVTYFKRITKDHSHFSPALLKKLWKEIKKFDVVHIHAWWNLVSVLSCWIAVMRKVPVVVSPRGTLSAYSFTNKNNLPKKLIHNLLGRGLLNRSFIHTTSNREKESIQSIIQPKKIINIANFIALPERINIEREESGPALKLLFFSRIEEKKGLDILFNSLALVNIPYHLTIAGDGDANYTAYLKDLATSKGISSNLSWIGFQGENKFDILYQHDLMILPSHDENFGNVVIESLSVGTPVLISKYVGLADYVADNNLGWICDLDQDNIAACINNIEKDRGKLSAIRGKAPGLIRNDYSDIILIKKYLDMYNQIIHND